MAQFADNQRSPAGSNYDKNHYTCRNGNMNIRYQKDANGRMVPVARPAFIKIK